VISRVLVFKNLTTFSLSYREGAVLSKKPNNQASTSALYLYSPMFANHQPSTINHQPSTINHQPSTINHQTSTIKHQPLTINHQLSTINNQLSIFNFIILNS
jgi:hypothetical protein